MHSIEKLYNRLHSKYYGTKTFYDNIAKFYEENGYTFTKRKGNSFSINGVPFFLVHTGGTRPEINSCTSFVFDTDYMSDTMFDAFRKEDKNFELQEFENLEDVIRFLKNFPLYGSKKLGKAVDIGVLEHLKKYNKFNGN